MTPTCKLFIEKYIDQLNNFDTEACFTIFSELYLLGQDVYDEVLQVCFSAHVDLLTKTNEVRKLVIVNATVANIKLLWTSSDENKRVNLTTLKDMLTCTLSLTNEDLKDCFQQAGRQLGVS
jgi:hypothetical protein